MSTTTDTQNDTQPQAGQSAGELPDFKIVSRIDGVPVIHDSVAYAHQLLQSTSPTAYALSTAYSLFEKSYSFATPILTRTKPLLESVDGLAVATFDRAEATYPYAFKTPTQDLVVVKQAKGVYDVRIAPWVSKAQPVISDVVNRTAEINSALGSRAHATIQSTRDLSYELAEQLKSVSAQGVKLPGHLRDAVFTASHDVKEILLAKDSDLGDKTNKLGSYVVDKVKPVVDQIYEYVLGAKKKAEETAAQVADQAQQSTENNSN